MLNPSLMLFLAVGWATSGFSQSVGKPPIVIGVSNVQSGPSRSLGQELVRGSKAYFNILNGSGGVWGRQISLVLKDDRYEPEPAIQNTEDLITKEKAFFLFDYVGTPTLTRVLPLLQYHRSEGIVNIAPFTGAEPQRNPPYSPYVFNIRASYREEAHLLVDYFYAKGFRRIGFMGQSDAYGKSGEMGVAEALEKHGLKIVARVAYRRNQTGSDSMLDQVNFLRRKDVDAVIAVGVYGPCGSFIRDARLSHWNLPIANLSFVDAEEMLSILRAQSKAAHMDLTRNLINSQVVPFPKEAKIPLVKSYLAHVGYRNANFTSLEGWLNALVVSEALKRAGEHPSRRSFVQAMESLHGWDPGIGYPLLFSPSNHQGLHKVWLTRTENSAWVAEPFPE